MVYLLQISLGWWFCTMGESDYASSDRSMCPETRFESRTFFHRWLTNVLPQSTDINLVQEGMGDVCKHRGGRDGESLPLELWTPQSPHPPISPSPSPPLSFKHLWESDKWSAQGEEEQGLWLNIAHKKCKLPTCFWRACKCQDPWIPAWFLTCRLYSSPPVAAVTLAAGGDKWGRQPERCPPCLNLLGV